MPKHEFCQTINYAKEHIVTKHKLQEIKYYKVVLRSIRFSKFQKFPWAVGKQLSPLLKRREDEEIKDKKLFSIPGKIL